jgi:hypothetical protein
MHQHGPDELSGPVRGTSAWWRGMGAPPATAEETGELQACTGIAETDIRWELVRRVRKEIEAGTYDRPERWERALERLHGQLEAE